jgi:hypothetical protein
MKTLIFCIIILISSTSYANDSKRSKSINFEDELVEGINRKPLDSVNQLSEFEANQRKHLYSKRAGFVDRDKVVMAELKLKH